jgi:hypothetical protein
VLRVLAGRSSCSSHDVSLGSCPSLVSQAFANINLLQMPCLCPYPSQAEAAAAATAACRAFPTGSPLSGLAGFQACRSLLAASRDQEAAAAAAGQVGAKA